MPTKINHDSFQVIVDVVERAIFHTRYGCHLCKGSTGDSSCMVCYGSGLSPIPVNLDITAGE